MCHPKGHGMKGVVVKASAHVVIGRDGKVFQLVPFDTEAWHAGRSRYAGRSNLNRYSVGIELDNSFFDQMIMGRLYYLFVGIGRSCDSRYLCKVIRKELRHGE